MTDLTGDLFVPPGWDEFVKFVSVNNNVAWRNFDVISVNPLADGEVELEFLPPP